MRCHQCKSESFVRRPVELVTDVGEVTVVDRTLGRPVCTQCGAYTIPADEGEAFEIRAAAKVLWHTERISGEMLRFARRALGMTQAELGQELGVTLETVSRWEREERAMEPWVRLAIFALVLKRTFAELEGLELKRAS